MIIGKTIEDLVDKGALNMSVNEDGEILYSANKDFQFETVIYFNKRYIIINLDNTEEFLLK